MLSSAPEGGPGQEHSSSHSPTWSPRPCPVATEQMTLLQVASEPRLAELRLS